MIPIPHPLRCATAWLGMAIAGFSPLLGGPSRRVAFNIPAGAAAATLREFSSQSGEQVFYSNDEVAGVTTQAVVGTMAPAEAIHRMLEGTALDAAQASPDDVFTIQRRSGPAPSNPGRSDPPPSDAQAETSMSLTPAEAEAAGVTVELPPFEVAENSQTGYLATETTGGTRLRSDVRDLANSMTVLTDAFLDDIAANNFYDALEHAPSTGNWMADAADDQGNTLRTSTPYWVRGFRVTTIDQDFFGIVLVPIDRFNTDGLVLDRGPNSILFGVSSPGGLINTSLKRAVIDASVLDLQGRLDSEQSRRVTADINRAIVPGKLAVRFDLLDEDLNDFRHGRNDRKSAYGSLDYHPFEGTSLYLDYELGTIFQNVAHPLIVYDYYTPWVQAGRPLSTSPAAGTGGVKGLAAVSTTNYLVYIPGSSIPIMNWKNQTMGAVPTNPATGASEPQVSITNPSILPLNSDIAGPRDVDNDNYDTFTAFLEQRIAPRLYVELASFREEVRNINDTATIENADQAVRVDTNEYLPNGAPNPYVGQPYIEAATYSYKNLSTQTEAENRGTLSYDLDLSEHKIGPFDLGDYRFQALVSENQAYQIYDPLVWVNTTPLAGFSTQVGNAQNRIHTRTYLKLGGNDQFVLGDFNQLDQDGVNGAWLRSSSTAPRNTLTEIRTKAAALQAFLLNHRLVILAGVRRDDSLSSLASFATDANGIYNSPWTAQRGAAFDNAGDTSTLGAVLHLNDHWSLTYNRSQSFSPSAASNLDIFGDIMGPVTGLGQDYGIRYDLLKYGVSANLVYYRTLSNGNVLNNSTERGNKTTWVDDIWSVVDPGMELTNTAWRDSEDYIAEGWEFQMVASPGRGWNFALAASRDTNTVLDYDDIFQRYLAEYSPLWQSKAATPVASTGGSTVGAVLNSINAELASDLAQIGQNAVGTSIWHADATADWDLPPMGKVRGAFVGGNYDFYSAPIIGYGAATAHGTPVFYGSATNTVNLFAGYRFHVTRRHYPWRVQVNVNNVFGHEREVPLAADDDGSGHPFYEYQTLTPPCSCVVTAELKF